MVTPLANPLNTAPDLPQASHSGKETSLDLPNSDPMGHKWKQHSKPMNKDIKKLL